MMPKVDLKKGALPLEFARGDASSRQHTYAGQGHGRKEEKKNWFVIPRGERRASNEIIN